MHCRVIGVIYRFFTVHKVSDNESFLPPSRILQVHSDFSCNEFDTTPMRPQVRFQQLARLGAAEMQRLVFKFSMVRSNWRNF